MNTHTDNVQKCTDTSRPDDAELRNHSSPREGPKQRASLRLNQPDSGSCQGTAARKWRIKEQAQQVRKEFIANLNTLAVGNDMSGVSLAAKGLKAKSCEACEVKSGAARMVLSSQESSCS